ncbi:uncharacterized protein LOC121367247 [Gigantopelta aegis]|uniref:uncharacterized protein LOC121367247 n=1 Tax=Gigantopelta aegis TaxID=1735272 RepID=UPI001B889CAC|nr:uncharacterized protein LOC121367247 [Gigantopelta aegis]
MTYQGAILKTRTRVLWILLSLVVNVQGGDYFDCRRDGQDCANSKTCLETGVDTGYCDCGGTTYLSYDCGLEDALKDTGPCTSLTDYCGTGGGVCYNNSGTAACHCPASAYGNQCQLPRYDVTCGTSSMLIVLNPYGTFGGVIYVDGNKKTAGCTFTTTDLPAGRQGLALNVLDTDCGGATINSANNKSRDVIVQFNNKYLTSVDSLVTVTCAEGTNTVEIQNDITIVRNTKQQNIDNVPDVDSAAVEFNIRLKDGTLASSNVPLDDKLTLEFIASPVTTTCTYTEHPDQQGDESAYKGLSTEADLKACQAFCDQTSTCVAAQYTGTACHLYTTPQYGNLTALSGTTYVDKVCVTSGYAAIRLESCTANNKRSDADLETLKIVENGCPSSEIGKLMKARPARSPSTTITLQLQPFMLNNNNAILLSCVIKVCPAQLGSFCDSVDCNGQSGFGRKRRSVHVSDETVTKSFTVRRVSSPNETETAHSSDEVCEPEVNLITPIIAGVAVVTFLLLVICTVTLVLLKKKRSNRKKKSGYKEEA